MRSSKSEREGGDDEEKREVKETGIQPSETKSYGRDERQQQKQMRSGTRKKKLLAKKSWSDIKNSIMKNNDKNVKSLWLNSAKIVCGGSWSQKRRRNRGEMKYGKWIECMVGKCSRNAHKFTRSRRKCSWTNFFSSLYVMHNVILQFLSDFYLLLHAWR